MENEVRNKTDTRYNPVPVEVTSVNGSNVTLRRYDGRVFDRNASKLKQVLPSETDSVVEAGDALVNDDRTDSVVDADPTGGNGGSDRVNPARRERTVPSRLAPYILYTVYATDN